MKNSESQNAGREQSANDTGKEFAARRRVLKGLISVPVAVTLSNGAALAGSSSQCYLKIPPEAADGETYCLPGDTDEVWSRFGYTKTQQANGQQTKYCLDYVDDAGDDIPVTIDQNGWPVRPTGENRHPLTISCATSFL